MGKLFCGLGFAATPPAGAVLICTCCDRGQRYCSPQCRGQARWRQRRAANRRISGASKGGWIIATGRAVSLPPAAVPRDGSRFPSSRISPTIGEWKSGHVPTLAPLRFRPCDRPGYGLRCVVCGRAGRFVDPFPRTSSRR